MTTIVLDNIRSSWNVGAIMRTCDALGFDLILVGYTPRPEGQTLKLVKKTAIGAENTVKWEHFEHYQEVFDKYPNQTHLAIEISTNSQDFFEFLKDKTERQKLENCFLWFGNEIHGLSQDLTNCCYRELHLPMNGTKESLNISSTVCAAGYLLQLARTL